MLDIEQLRQEQLKLIESRMAIIELQRNQVLASLQTMITILNEREKLLYEMWQKLTGENP